MRHINEAFTPELRNYIDKLVNDNNNGMVLVPVFILMKKNFLDNDPNLMDLLLSSIVISSNIQNVNASFERNKKFEAKHNCITYSCNLPLNYIFALGLLIPDIEGITLDKKRANELKI